MSNELTVVWCVDDGYLSNHKFRCSIDVDEFQYCTTAEEVDGVLHQIIQEVFENKVTFAIKNAADIVADVMAYKAEKSE